MQTAAEMRKALEAKAASDPEFRAQLIDDPKAAMREALGVNIPDEMDVQVHDQNERSIHLVLPPKGALNEQELGVAGGVDLLKLLFPHSQGNPTRDW